jgi:hypothetical protein
MGVSAVDGAFVVWGDLSNIPAGMLSPEAVPDPNSDAGPSLFFQGIGIPDARTLYVKDKVQGWRGSVQAHYDIPELESTRQIPVALSTTGISAAVAVVSGTAMTLPTSNALGFNINVPVRQFSPVLDGGPVVTAALALDFGFGFGTAVSGTASMVVGNALDFYVGMPIVMAPTSGTSSPFLTIVTGITLSTNTLTLLAAPGFSGTCAIGTGDLWGPNEVEPGFPVPQAAMPFLGKGPGLFLDARQVVSRCISITTGSAATGGAFLISGMDIYGQPMSQLLTTSAASTTYYTTKCFKYITSIVPQFSDSGASHTYSVGTGDTFGLSYRAKLFEDLTIYWGAVQVTGGAIGTPTANGFVAADDTIPPTTTTGDVRGSFQAGAGAGTKVLNGPASTGALSGLLLSGLRLEIVERIGAAQNILATQAAPYYLFGQTQV